MSSNPPIVFVVRASVTDGLGHLVRSLCVLRELVRLSPVHLLLVGDASGAHLIDDAEIPWTRCESDEKAADESRRRQAKLVVFDTLTFDSGAFERLADGMTTVSLSPVFSRMSGVGHLFHRTLVEDPAWSGEAKFPMIHKGLEYAVLPSWLRRVDTNLYREHLQEGRLAVAISMGGTDAPNRTLALLKLLGEMHSRLVLFVALGDAYRHSYEELLDCAARSRQEIILLKSNESMWRVLKNVSLVVCAGGLTTYEAAFIGLPTINILQQADWAYLFQELEAAGACKAFAPGGDSLMQAVELVASFERERGTLLRMHESTRNLIPDQGARRIATKLLSLVEQA
jgi:spore coat polysaccharide biosynthesis predicted glycosyltransferase SpsG